MEMIGRMCTSTIGNEDVAPAHKTADGICRHIIDPMKAPPAWNTDKWLGAAESMNWHGLWLNTHGLLFETYRIAFCTKQVLEADVGGGDLQDADGREDLRFGHSDVGSSQKEHGLGDEPLPDPKPESTSFERLSTYRSNAMK